MEGLAILVCGDIRNGATGEAIARYSDGLSQFGGKSDLEFDVQVFAGGAHSAAFNTLTARSVTHSFGSFIFPNLIQVFPS